jgi:transposase-like protein
MPRRRRHSPEQIIRKLAEGNKLLAGGAELDAVCRHLEIAESTWHRWLAQYGGMKASDAKRLKELEVENTRLKKLLAEAELDKAMLKELAEGNFQPRTVAGLQPPCCSSGSGSPNEEPAGSSASTAPPSVWIRQCQARTRSSYAGSCGTSRANDPAGDGAVPPSRPEERAGS